jgi:hypothetical protein
MAFQWWYDTCFIQKIKYVRKQGSKQMTYAPCKTSLFGRFGGTWWLYREGYRILFRRMLKTYPLFPFVAPCKRSLSSIHFLLPVTAAPTWTKFSSCKMKAAGSSETSEQSLHDVITQKTVTWPTSVVKALKHQQTAAWNLDLSLW